MQESKDVAAMLESLGLDARALLACGEVPKGARVVVVQASLEDSRKALGDLSRDHVVMARVDLDTAQALDRWVDVGLARSRSEAAALFIREGLRIREADLVRLASAFANLDNARERLKIEAAKVLGDVRADDTDREIKPKRRLQKKET